MTTISEAANVLRVSEKTVRRRIKDGSLPAQLVGEPPRYEIPHDAIVDLASNLPAAREPLSGEMLATLNDVMEALQGQLKEKDRQLEEKDRQIRELHVLLQTSQEQLSRVMLPPPEATVVPPAADLPKAAPKAHPWWQFWS